MQIQQKQRVTNELIAVCCHLTSFRLLLFGSLVLAVFQMPNHLIEIEYVRIIFKLKEG